MTGLPLGAIPWMRPIPPQAGFGAAYSTLPVAPAQICIRRIVRMALWAMRLFRALGRWTSSAKRVFLVGYDFKVRRIDATSDAAKVVNSEPFRYWPAKMLIRESVCVPGFIIETKRAVSILLEGPSPEPTVRGFFDECKKTLYGVAFFIKSFPGNCLSAALEVDNHGRKLYVILHAESIGL